MVTELEDFHIGFNSVFKTTVNSYYMFFSGANRHRFKRKCRFSKFTIKFMRMKGSRKQYNQRRLRIKKNCCSFRRKKPRPILCLITFFSSNVIETCGFWLLALSRNCAPFRGKCNFIIHFTNKYHCRIDAMAMDNFNMVWSNQALYKPNWGWRFDFKSFQTIPRIWK